MNRRTHDGPLAILLFETQSTIIISEYIKTPKRAKAKTTSTDPTGPRRWPSPHEDYRPCFQLAAQTTWSGPWSVGLVTLVSPSRLSRHQTETPKGQRKIYCTKRTTGFGWLLEHFGNRQSFSCGVGAVTLFQTYQYKDSCSTRLASPNTCPKLAR